MESPLPFQYPMGSTRPVFSISAGSRVQFPFCIVTARHGQLHAPQPTVLDLSVRKLGYRAVQHNMLAVGARHRQNERVVSNPAVFPSPCGHIGHCVGPADADEASVCCQPAISTAAQPVVVVSQRHQTDAVLFCQHTGAFHRTPGVQRAKASMAVPAFQHAGTQFTGRAGAGICLLRPNNGRCEGNGLTHVNIRPQGCFEQKYPPHPPRPAPQSPFFQAHGQIPAPFPQAKATLIRHPPTSRLTMGWYYFAHDVSAAVPNRPITNRARARLERDAVRALFSWPAAAPFYSLRSEPQRTGPPCRGRYGCRW